MKEVLLYDKTSDNLHTYLSKQRLCPSKCATSEVYTFKSRTGLWQNVLQAFYILKQCLSVKMFTTLLPFKQRLCPSYCAFSCILNQPFCGSQIVQLQATFLLSSAYDRHIVLPDIC